MDGDKTTSLRISGSIVSSEAILKTCYWPSRDFFWPCARRRHRICHRCLAAGASTSFIPGGSQGGVYRAGFGLCIA